jgi:hypothetical protein
MQIRHNYVWALYVISDVMISIPGFVTVLQIPRSTNYLIIAVSSDHAKAAKLVLQVATYSQYYFHYDPTAL